MLFKKIARQYHFFLYGNAVSYKVKKLLIKAMYAGVGMQFCYYGNYNIKLFNSCIKKGVKSHRF